jgi:hypothetical protein
LEKKFSDKPKWIKLHEDKHLDLLDNDDFPGSVLLQLGVGTDAEWDEAESSWKDSVAQMQHRTPYELRVHIFQVTPRRGRQPLIDVVFEPKRAWSSRRLLCSCHRGATFQRRILMACSIRS